MQKLPPKGVPQMLAFLFGVLEKLLKGKWSRDFLAW